MINVAGTTTLQVAGTGRKITTSNCFQEALFRLFEFVNNIESFHEDNEESEQLFNDTKLYLKKTSANEEVCSQLKGASK